MATQGDASFAQELRRAIQRSRTTQADLARKLDTDAGQVSRWANSKTVPHIDTVRRIEEILDARLIDSFRASTPDYELFVSAPIIGLAADEIAQHRDSVAEVVSAARQHVNNLYWSGEQIRAPGDLAAADLLTARNMQILVSCSAYLYVQFAPIVHPSSALVELGFALGRRLKTTIIFQSGLAVPYMLGNFGAVASELKFLPKARIYPVESVTEAVSLITRNGRELLGLT